MQSLVVYLLLPSRRMPMYRSHRLFACCIGRHSADESGDVDKDLGRHTADDAPAPPEGAP